MLNFEVIRQQQNHMATTFDFRISCETARSALADRVLSACHTEVARLESELSEFLVTSPVYRLNHAPVGERIVFTRDGIELLEKADSLRRRSGGAFNPLAKSQSEQARQSSLEWNFDTREVWSCVPGTWLGFGAIGKGFALDRARFLIDAAGFENYILSGGGSSIALSGYEGSGRPWRLGWSWKKSDLGEDLGIPFAHWSGRRISLGISGTHEKGQHIIDGRGHHNDAADTSAPLYRLRSALIATQSATDADALSTALFVSGWEDSSRYLAELPSPPAAAWIDDTETPHWNGLFAQLWPVIQKAAYCFFLSLPFLALSRAIAPAYADQAIDLGALGGAANSFTPYDFERNSWWIALPIFVFLIVLSHLRQTKPKRERKKLTEKIMKKVLNKTNVSIFLAASLAWTVAETAHAVTIEPLGKAVMAVLGTPKAFAKSLGGTQVYYSKNSSGRADKVAFIEHGTYLSCEDVWVVGVNAATARVTQARVMALGCPAYSQVVRSASFVDQFRGKGPADAARLESEVHVVAKATGSSKLAAQAVQKAIKTMETYRGQL